MNDVSDTTTEFSSLVCSFLLLFFFWFALSLHVVWSYNKTCACCLGCVGFLKKKSTVTLWSVLYLRHWLILILGMEVIVVLIVFVSLRFLPQLAETRREFVRIGEDLETAAVKNAHVSRHKSADAERASHLLLATRKCYQHFALDYCLQVHTSWPTSAAHLRHLWKTCSALHLYFWIKDTDVFCMLCFLSSTPSRLSRRLTS